MNNYRVQNSCYNCRFVLEDSIQDCGTYFYCNLGEIISLKAFFLPKTKNQRLEKVDFEKKFEVDECGICDDWEEISNVANLRV